MLFGQNIKNVKTDLLFACAKLLNQKGSKSLNVTETEFRTFGSIY